MRSHRELRPEWIAASVVLVSVLACSALLHAHTADVDAATAARQRQVERLTALRRSGPPREEDLRACQSLFGGYTIVHEATEWGGFLAVQSAPGGVR